MPRILPIALLAASCTFFAAAPSARANGRFPAADHLVVNPSDPSHLVLRATFGLLQSTDAGQSWRWICEESIGYSGTDDPPVTVDAGGTIILGLLAGLPASDDRGCTWVRGGDAVAAYRIVDLSTEKADPTSVLAITAEDERGLPHALIVETTDGGDSWTQVGIDLPAGFIPQTLDSAPSNRDVLYVSGNMLDEPDPPLLLRSFDRGASWETLEFDSGTRRAYISAIDPVDPEKVYVRLQKTDEDSLIVSDDAGASWTPVLTLVGPMLGFALSPDGSQVAAGTKAGGLFIGSSESLDLVEVAPISVRCLTWAEEGLYVCADEAADGATVGLWTDELEPLYNLLELQPLECPAGTSTAETCPALWPAIEEFLGNSANGDGGAPTETTSSTSSSGGGGSGGGAGDDDGSGGCDCTTSRGSTKLPPAAMLGLLVVFARRLRRKTRS